MPQAKTELHNILVREDCGGQQAAEAAAGVVQKLAGVLDAVSVDHILFIDEDPTVVASQKSKWTNANAFKGQKRPTMRASKQFRGEAMDMLSRCYRQVAAATHLQEDHILTTR